MQKNNYFKKQQNKTLKELTQKLKVLSLLLKLYNIIYDKKEFNFVCF